MQQQRRTPRQQVNDGWIIIRDVLYTLKDWSAEGFYAEMGSATPPPNDEDDCTLRVRSDLGVIEINGRYKMVRRTDLGFAGNWTLESKSSAHDLIIQHFFVRELKSDRNPKS